MSFASPNYTQVPNVLLDDVLPEVDSLGELKVTLVVARRTLGWHRQRVPLTLTRIQQLSGLARTTASKGLQAALERGTVVREVHGKDHVYSLAIGSDSELPKNGAGSESLPLTGSESLPTSARASDFAFKEKNKENTYAPEGARSDDLDVPVERRQDVPLLSERGAADAVWEHYVEARQSSPKKLRRTELDPETRRMINAALKVATFQELKTAVDGLFCSPHHLGNNDRSKTYLDPEYVFKGHSGKTTRSQIEMFLEIAEKAGVGPSDSSVDPATFAEAKRNVLTAFDMPRSGQARKMAEMSAAWLAQHGYCVVNDPETGRPTFVLESEE